MAEGTATFKNHAAAKSVLSSPRELKEMVDAYEVKVSNAGELDAPRISLRVGGCFIHFQSVSSWQKIKYKVDDLVEQLEKEAESAGSKL